MAIVLNWNVDDLPEEARGHLPTELRGLPPGRYVLEPIDEVPELTDEEEASIQSGIDSIRAGEGVGLDAAKTRVGGILAR